MTTQMLGNTPFKPVIRKMEIDDSHFYFVKMSDEGEEIFFPSVTAILDETIPMNFLAKWRGDVGNDFADAKLERSKQRGSAIHDACERILNGDTIMLHDEFPIKNDQKCVVAFMDFLAALQPEILATEETVASRYGFAGTLDIRCKIDPMNIDEYYKTHSRLKKPVFDRENPNWIIDIKTSASIHPKNFFQVAAYDEAVAEMYGVRSNLMVLHLDQKMDDPAFKMHINPTIGDYKVRFHDFLGLFETYKVLNGGKIPEPPVEIVYPETLAILLPTKK